MNNKQVRTKMQAALEHFNEQLQTVRTGRANAGLIENLTVTHYEQQMPLKALANITTPDGKSITIAPWDATATAAIEKAIRDDKSLDLTPMSDGKTIHINVPPPTADRRQQLTKQVSEEAEKAHVSLRNVRHEALKNYQEQLKDKQISEDEFDRLKKELDELVKEFGDEVERIAEAKKQDITTI